MKKIISGCLLSMSFGSMATIQTTSTYTNINFYPESYVSVDIKSSREYMTVEDNDKKVQQWVSVPMSLDWQTTNGVRIVGSCSSNPIGLCKDHGYMVFPALTSMQKDMPLYLKNSEKELILDDPRLRNLDVSHTLHIGVDDSVNFLKNYGHRDESVFLYKITIEARP
ncbi:hypothetical protein AB733_19210 [Photobacterium swingsii]|uniref:Uncharacterized protein n=1 Tax=Photobacterium swingsii TaxID=680026 RepID=A0A0J8V7T0_9GAMM|nr:hypothetical protein [Photobacterium swingsii]KMV29232.1 hypothetical protein AB733_19210 [Photobacterium swingsii]PSW23177.1 hypothetical protein C9I94_16255 [Photobacterium swingsii]